MAPKSLASAPARLSFKGRNGEAADLEVACAWGSFSNQGAPNGVPPSATIAGGGGVGRPAPAVKLPVDSGQPYGRSSYVVGSPAPLGGDTSEETESVEEDGAAVSFLGPGVTSESRGDKAPLVRFATNSISGRLPGLVTLPTAAAASGPRAGLQQPHRPQSHQQHQQQQHQYRPHSRAAAEVRSKSGGGADSDEEDDEDDDAGLGPGSQGAGPRSSWSRHGVQKKPILKSKSATEGGGLVQPAQPRRPVLFQDPSDPADSPGSLSAPAKHLSYRHLEGEEDDDDDPSDEEPEGMRANARSGASDSAAAARHAGVGSNSGAAVRRNQDGADRAGSAALASGRAAGPRATIRFEDDGNDSDGSGGDEGHSKRLGTGKGAGRTASSTTAQGKKAPRPATGYRYHAAPDSPRQQEGHGLHGHQAGSAYNHTARAGHPHGHAHVAHAHASAHGHGHGAAAATASASGADATWGHITRSAAPKPVLRLRQGSYTSMGSVHSFVGSPGSLAAAARPAAHRAGGSMPAEASGDSGSNPGLWDTDSEPASESELIVEGPSERASTSGQHHHTIGGRGSGAGVGSGAGGGSSSGPAAPAHVYRRSSHNGGSLAAAAPGPGPVAGPGGVAAPMVPASAAGRGALHSSMGEWKQGVRQWKHGAGYDAQQLQPLPPPVPKPILQNRRSAPGTVGASSAEGGGFGGYAHSRLQQQRAQRKLRFEVPAGGAPAGAADDEDEAMDPQVAAAAAARSKAGARVATPAANPAAKTGWRGAWRRITAALGRRPSTPAPKDMMRRAAEKAAATAAAGGREADEDGDEEDVEEQDPGEEERVEVRPVGGAARRPPTGKPASKRGAGRSVGFAVADSAGTAGGGGDCGGVGGKGGARGPSGGEDAEDEQGVAVEPTEQSAIVRRPRAMDSRVAHRKRMAHNVGRQPSLYVAADRAIRFQLPKSSDDSDGEEEEEEEESDGEEEENVALAGGPGEGTSSRGRTSAGVVAEDDEDEGHEGGDVVAAVGLRERSGQDGWRRPSASGLAAETSGSPRSARLSSGAGAAPSSRGSKRNSHSSSGAGLYGDEADAGPLPATISPRSPGSLLATGISGGVGSQTSPSGAAAVEGSSGGANRPRVAFSLRGGGSNVVAPSPPGTREQSPGGSHGGAGPSSSSPAASPMQHASPVAGSGGVAVMGPRRTVTLGTMSSVGPVAPALSSPAPPPGPPPAPPPGEPTGPRLLRRNLTNASEASRRDVPSPSVSMSGAAPPSAPPSRHVSMSSSGFGSGAGAAAAAAAVAAAAGGALPSPLAGVPGLHLHAASSVSSNASSAHATHTSPHQPAASTPGRAQHVGPTSRLFAETSASALPVGGRHSDPHHHSLSRSLPHSKAIGGGAGSAGGGHEQQPSSPGGSGSFVGSDGGENSGRWRSVFNKIKSAMSGGGSSRDSSPGRGGSPGGSGRNTPRRGSVASMSDSGRGASAAGEALGGDGGGGDASEPPTPTAGARHRAMDSRISHRKRMALERKPSLVMAASRVLAEEEAEQEAAAAAAASAAGVPGSGGGASGSRDRVVRFDEMVAHRKSAPGTLYVSGGDRWSADGRDGTGGEAGAAALAAATYTSPQQNRHSMGTVPAITAGRGSSGGAGASTSGGGAAAPAPPAAVDGDRRTSRGGFLTRLRESLTGRN